MDRCTIFIDESGCHHLNNPQERYLTLLGVIMRSSYAYGEFHNDMEKVKYDIFPSHSITSPIIFHQKDIINRRYQYTILKDDDVRLTFDTSIKRIIQDSKCKLIAILVDKHAFRDKYTNPRDCYCYCTEVLIERYLMFLNSYDYCGDIVFEARDPALNKMLQESFLNHYNNGTDYIDSSLFQKRLTSNKIKFRGKSANISALQMADLIVKPTAKYAIRDILNVTTNVTAYTNEIINLLVPKFHVKKDGSIQGAGIKVLP